MRHLTFPQPIEKWRRLSAEVTIWIIQKEWLKNNGVWTKAYEEAPLLTTFHSWLCPEETVTKRSQETFLPNMELRDTEWIDLKYQQWKVVDKSSSSNAVAVVLYGAVRLLTLSNGMEHNTTTNKHRLEHLSQLDSLVFVWRFHSHTS